MVHTVDHLPPQPHNLSTNQKVCSTIPSSSILHVKTSWSPSFVLRTHPSVSVYVSVLDTKNEYVRGHVTMMCSAKCCVRSSVTSFCSTVKFQEDWTIKWAGMILHWNRSNINSAIILWNIAPPHQHYLTLELLVKTSDGKNKDKNVMVERVVPVGWRRVEKHTESGARPWAGRTSVTSQIRLRNLCIRLTEGLVSLGVGSSYGSWLSG